MSAGVRASETEVGGRSEALEAEEGSEGKDQAGLLSSSSAGGRTKGFSGVGRGVSSLDSEDSWLLSNSRSKASAQSRGVRGSAARYESEVDEGVKASSEKGFELSDVLTDVKAPHASSFYSQWGCWQGDLDLRHRGRSCWMCSGTPGKLASAFPFRVTLEDSSVS